MIKAVKRQSFYSQFISLGTQPSQRCTRSLIFGRQFANGAHFQKGNNLGIPRQQVILLVAIFLPTHRTVAKTYKGLNVWVSTCERDKFPGSKSELYWTRHPSPGPLLQGTLHAICLMCTREENQLHVQPLKRTRQTYFRRTLPHWRSIEQDASKNS